MLAASTFGVALEVADIKDDIRKMVAKLEGGGSDELARLRAQVAELERNELVAAAVSDAKDEAKKAKADAEEELAAAIATVSQLKEEAAVSHSARTCMHAYLFFLFFCFFGSYCYIPVVLSFLVLFNF